MLNSIRKLCSLSGISGSEDNVRRYILEQLKNAPAVASVRTDRLGNCIVSLKGKQAAPHKVMFAAHMDEVGGIITGITGDGYLRFDTVGSIMPDVLLGRTVWINGHAGVIGAKAIHQCKGDEKKTVPTIAKMLIDIGADSEEEARQYVTEGDAVTFSDAFTELGDNRTCVKALDDRVGCAILLRLAQTTPQYDVTLAFTVQEEVGLRGAMTAAFAEQPEIGVALDATTAADIADVPDGKTVTYQGNGPVVSFMDRRTLYDHSLYRHIRALAEENGIPTQTKTSVAGGNDAASLQQAGAGARVAAISLPCRYIHSATSVMLNEDAENMYRLTELLANTLPAYEESV